MADNELPAQIPYRRERTPSIVVQSLGLSFHKDSNITESVELADEESDIDNAGPNSDNASELTDLRSGSGGSGTDANTNQTSCDNLSTTGNSNLGSATSLHTSPGGPNSSPVRSLRGSLMFQGANEARPPKAGADAANRRFSLNIGSTAPRRQSLTVDGLSSAFKDLPIAASAGNATGSLRNKAALKPGHSLMGWIRLASTAKDLSGTGGKIMEVTASELEKHNTEKDCWVALKGNVYNVTIYLQYHPGGVDELMRGAGKDATELFNEVHRWVNYESILAKCFVGPLKMDSPLFATMTESPTRCSSAHTSPKTHGAPNRHCDPTIAQRPSRRQSIALTVPSPNQYQSLLVRPNQIQQPPTYVIFQDKTSIRLRISNFVTLPRLRSRHIICDFDDQGIVHVSIILTPDWLYRIHLRMDQDIDPKPQAIISNEDKTINIKINKKKVTHWKTIGNSLDLNDSLCEMTLSDKYFRPCKLLSKQQLTHDTYFMEFGSDNSFMYVPIGWHVLIRAAEKKEKKDPNTTNGNSVEQYDDDEYQLHKNYTPVVKDILTSDGLTDESAGSMMNSLNFIIKIYPNGVLTQKLNALSIGQCVEISDYQWVDFDIEAMASEPRHWAFLCAGTGFTPMVRVMSYLLNCVGKCADSVKSIKLIFFNRTQRDIIWRDKLDQIAKRHESLFKITHVLSDEPLDSDWKGERGLINKDLVSSLIIGSNNKNEDRLELLANLRLLSCGPRTFTQLTKSIANDIGLASNLYCFHG